MTVAEKRKALTIDEFFGPKTVSKKVKTNIQDVQVREDVKAEVVGESSDFKTDISTNTKKQSNKLTALSTAEVQKEFEKGLSEMLKQLLKLELETMEPIWFKHLENEFKKPYFIKLKQFLQEEQARQTIFPPSADIYSWSRLTPFDKVKVVIIGQDPYHNHGQAHGLAFSVKSPTPAPPSLKNIYKELRNNYPDFVINNKCGDLTPWATQGVLLLNTALTVRAHNANSHSKKGWEQLTRRVVEVLLADRLESGKSLIFLLWGGNATKLVDTLLSPQTAKSHENIKVFRSVHPSPLSASRGFYGNNHFKKINDWLYNDRQQDMIDWSVQPGSKLADIKTYQSKKIESNFEADTNLKTIKPLPN